jgi:lipopolysaccharide transport system permease protein
MTASGRGNHLFLLRELVRRDLQGRYAGSWLGLLWSIAQPLWQLALYSFVFGGVLQVSPLGQRTDRFWVFLFCGLLPWTAIQEGVSRSTQAITDNSPLVKKLRFPPELLVASIVAAALVHQAIAGGVFVLVLAGLGELTWSGLPWLLLALPLQVALTVGLGLVLAACNVFFRDTAQVVGIVLAAWFYLTPIVYPLPAVPPRLVPWLEANPLTGLVGLYRAALVGQEGPLPGLSSLAVAAAASLAVGVWVFRRLRPTFADEM